MKNLILLTVMLLSIVLVGAPQHATAESIVVDGAFQSFERGYMIWHGDTGEILVLSNSGILLRFAESSYAGLSDNPIPDTSGALVYPVSGFGRVWGNNANVRNLLGWGLEEEYAINLALDVSSSGVVTGLTLPDGRDVELSGNRWSFVRTTPRSVSDIPVTADIPITYEVFEGGYMMWWSNTGSIWVLYNNGQTEHFPSTRYGGFSDYSHTVGAPAGRYIPPQGFGKVWSYFPHVRNRLGWATTWVDAFPMHFERVIINPSSFYGLVYFRISFPGGREVIMTDRNTWYFVD